MKNSEYWEKRIANNTWKTYNSLEEKNRYLLDMYQEASLNISEELYKVVEKLKTSNPTLSDMHKFNRLTNLQRNIENIIGELGENVESFGENNMVEGFQHTYSNVMAQLGITEFDKVPKKVMEEMLRESWLGSNFSERLWKNTQILASNLNELLTNGIIQGKTVIEIAIQLNNRMNEGFNVTHRLIRTETMHYLNESAFKGYRDAGCVEVELWAATDERTCKVCGAKHGERYRIKDRPILPLHANCRCTYLPVIDSMKDKEELDKLQNIKPPLPKRHRLESIGNKSNAKDKNTIILPRVDYIKDIEDIKEGMYNKVNDTYEINGRLYGYHSDRFYPVSGDGFITLNRHEYKILKIIKSESNTTKLEYILKNIKATKEEVEKIRNIIKEMR
ncbi:minor capsid protein [Clostridium tertium]|jgi:SPP1 gp7 family putative phage head morphogenesis protein|uniref:Minor capsid protein n=1 Tax=Clostridium tertium TaxID=1559 RepID=A0A9X4B284_9CLOT|nr:minor capsid protein [Clostridium tertium]MDC4242540.1 minor capsid protein [Clostridium tertium]